MKKRQMAGRFLSVLLAFATTVSFMPTVDTAAAPASSKDLVYVQMNIPYSDFYAAEGDDDVDIVTSATKSKPLSGTLAGGSYHVNEDGSDITGVTYPVVMTGDEFKAFKALGYREITDEDSFTVTVNMRGQEITTTYQGKDALFGAASYSYYVLSERPDFYKEADISKEGSLSFGNVVGEKTIVTDVSADFFTSTGYGDYQLNLSSDSVNLSSLTVYAATLNTSDGSVYGMRHIENIWRGQLAWSTGHTTMTHGCSLSYADYADMEGKTLSEAVFYTSEGIYVMDFEDAYVAPYYTGEVSASLTGKKQLSLSGLPADLADGAVTVFYTVGEGREAQKVYLADKEPLTGSDIALSVSAKADTVYTVAIDSSNYAQMTCQTTFDDPVVFVEMNIPYEKFYAAEGDSDVDIVSSATKSKPLSGTLAGGSYHVNGDGSDITGVTYAAAVHESDLEALIAAGGREITDEDSFTVTVNMRGQEITTTYEGKAALFGAPSYSYYVLSELPSFYKEVSVSEDTSLSFGEVLGEKQILSDVTAQLTTETGYGDYQLNLTAADVDLSALTVYAALVHTTDGASYGMRHIENIWRGQLAWSVGHTTMTHGCTLSYDNYADMEGKTLADAVFYTNEGIYVMDFADVKLLPYYNGTIEAAFAASDKVSLSGIPADAENVTVSIRTGGREPVYLAENAEVSDGLVSLAAMPADHTTAYTVTVKSDNYAVMTASVTCTDCFAGKGVVTKKATCTSKGTKTYSCQICGEVVKTTSLKKLAHTSDEGVITKAPTCTEEGLKTYSCTVCGSLIKTEAVEALAHSSDKGLVTKKASCSATGVKTYSCTRCGEVLKTTTLKKLSHTYAETSKITRATSSADGKIVTTKACTVCGHVSSTKTTSIKKIESVKLSSTKLVYNGKTRTPSVTVKDSAGNVIDSKYYTVSYADNKYVGKAVVTVKFKTNYSGTVKKYFTINPKGTGISSITPYSKALTVKLVKKTVQTSGYQIRISTSSKMTNVKTYTISSNTTTSKKITGLSGAKKYYVQVRTYKLTDGRKYYSSWSDSVAAATKK